MKQAQCITILGSTGSIGTSTLDVLARHPGQYRIHALTASSQVDVMLAQCVRFSPEFAVMVQEEPAKLLAEKVKAEGLSVRVLWGPEALDQVASDPQVDSVMAAIVGAAGLSPCIAAARAGKRLMLANKEALVVGGDVSFELFKKAALCCCRLTVNTPPFSSLYQRIQRHGSVAFKKSS